MTPDGLITSEFDDDAVLEAAGDAFDRFARYDGDAADGLEQFATAGWFARRGTR